jgi:thiosulfate/3-mercaptopyruvate sulfurtransferase
VLLSPFGQSASDMATAARVYWTFKALGHDRISILDGGLLGYARGGRDRPLQRGPVEAEGKTFKASVRGDYLVGKEQVQAALAKGEVLVDNRSRAEYLGVYRAGGKERPGTIGGSLNLPYDWLTVNGGGKLHALDDLKAIYQAVGVPLQGEQISFCHTGHRTALAWFVSHELLGNRQARLYDGSMAEWAADSSLPIASQVELQCASC